MTKSYRKPTIPKLQDVNAVKTSIAKRKKRFRHDVTTRVKRIRTPIERLAGCRNLHSAEAHVQRENRTSNKDRIRAKGMAASAQSPSTSQAFLARRYYDSFRKLTTIGNWLSTCTPWWGPSSIIYSKLEVEDGCEILPWL